MGFRIKTYLPLSLFGRAALILVVPIITIQLVVSVVFIQRHFDGVTRQLSKGLSLEVQYLMRRLDAAPDLSGAQQEAAGLAQDLSMQITLPANDPPAAGDKRDLWDLSGREVGTVLHDGLTQLTTVDLQADPREVRLWLTSSYGRCWCG